MSMYKVVASLNASQDHKAATENSEKNRDQFQFLYVSRLMVASVASFIAVFGIAIKSVDEGGRFGNFSPTLWLLFLSMLFALLAGYWTANAFVEQTKQNRHANNAQSYLNAGFRLAKQRDQADSLNTKVKGIENLLSLSIPELFSLEGYDAKIRECADEHWRIGYQGLKHRREASRKFVYVEAAAELSTALFLIAFLVPLIRMTLS